MFHGQGRGRVRNAEDAAFNLGGPSKRTRDKRRGGYTTTSGVSKDLHLAFITLANISNVPPFLETESVKVIGVAMENDGTPLKPGIQFDERMKKNVGLKQDVGIKFVRDNPNPTSQFLRESILTEANVSFITSLCNNLSMPVAVSYLTKSGKTGEDMQNFFLQQVRILQVCKACLERMPANYNTIQLLPEGICHSLCEECLENSKVCSSCAEQKQPSHIPCLRACQRCTDSGEQCLRCAVLVLTTDCEEGNKKAMELILKMQEERRIEPALRYLVFFPDSVHVGQSLKYSFCNWFIILRGERGYLAIVQTLRDDSNSSIRKRLRRLLRAGDVQNKDRMAVDPLLRLSSDDVINTLRDVTYVVHQMVPEKYRFSETNKAGMFPHPVAIACGQHGKLLFIDFDPMKRNSRLVEADFHNPVRIKVLKAALPDVRTLCYINSVGAVVLCEHGSGSLHVIDLEDKIKLKSTRLRDRETVVAELEKRTLSCTGTVKQLRDRLESHLQKERVSLTKGKVEVPKLFP